MALSDILRFPASRKVGIVDILSPLPLRQWTVDGTYPTAYYSDATDIMVDGVLQDGVAQTKRASVSDVHSLGGYFWDVANSRVYVKNPYAATLVQVVVAYHIATHAKDFDTEDFARSSRVSGVPTIHLEISPTFGGSQKTSSGSVEIVNNDSLFDNFPGLNFDAGSVTFKVAADLLR